MDSTLPIWTEDEIEAIAARGTMLNHRGMRNGGAGPINEWALSIVREVEAAMQARTIAYGAECRRLALEESMSACCLERIPVRDSRIDAAYNKATENCFIAIRALSSQGRQQEGGA